MLYIGFDLGDGESCLNYCRDDGPSIPLPVADVNSANSFISAVGVLDGRIVVGGCALNERAENTRVCFKRHFLEKKEEYDRAITDFAKGVLEDIRATGVPGVSEYIDDPEKVCFAVGCPAGWKPEDRERYKRLLTDAGMRNVTLVSESRAAFESFAMKEQFDVDRRLFNESVLVADMGSSTLDFSYVLGGDEQEVQVMGNTLLGGGMMDEMLLLKSVDMIPDARTREAVRAAIENNPSAKSKLMAAARKMKEDYFSNEDAYLIENRDYAKQAFAVADGRVLRFSLRVSPDIVENFVKSYPHPLLNGQTFEQRLNASLTIVKGRLKAQGQGDPKLVILTGGPSRMRFFQDMCREAFPGSRVVISDTPESDISEGLCRVAYMDSSRGMFLSEVRAYVAGPAVEDQVAGNLGALLNALAEPMTERIFSDCVNPCVEMWKEGRITTLNELSEQIEDGIRDLMMSDRMKREISLRTELWVKDLLPVIQKDIDAIAEKHRVRNNMLRLSGLTVNAGAGTPTGPAPTLDTTVIEWIMLTVTAVVCGMLCGGGGVALISAGPIGIVVGALIGIGAAALGADAAEKMIKDADIPVFLRRMIGIKKIDTPAERERVSRSIIGGFKKDTRMVLDLSEQIGEAIDRGIQKAVDKAEARM